MLEKERRSCRRYLMHLPVIISSPQAIATPEGWHYGKILDAGREGVRMKVESFVLPAVGSVVQMVWQTADNYRPSIACRPVPVKGKVVWHDADSMQFALKYMH